MAVLGRFSGVKLVPLKGVLPEIQSLRVGNQEMQFATPDGSAIVASYLNSVIVVRRATPGKSVIPDVRAFFQAIGSQLETRDPADGEPHGAIINRASLVTARATATRAASAVGLPTSVATSW